MGVTLKISGEDFSNYVVSAEREHSICDPIANIEFLLSPNLPRSIDTYEEVEFYENDTLVFTGYTSSIAKRRLPIECRLTCHDVLIKAQDTWIEGYLISGGESVGYWVGRFLSLADIHNLVMDASGDQGVYPGFGWDHTPAMEAIMQTLQMSPYQIICDRYGKIHLISMERSTAIKTIDDIIEFERSRNDRWIRNRIVVFGAAGLVADEFRPNAYLPGEIRAAVVATGAIHNAVTASTIAERMIDEFKNPLDVKIVTVPGDPSLEIGQTVTLVENWSGYTDNCLITSITSRYDEHTYEMELTLDEKCPNFWGWDSPPPEPITIYAGTWGEGVFRYEGPPGSWSETNLGDKYVYDIHVVDDLTVWAACRDGVYQTIDHGDNWTKFTMGTPSELRDGEEGITEVDLYWVGVVTKYSDSDAIYCLAGEFANRGIWIYYSSNTGKNWNSVRIV